MRKRINIPKLRRTALPTATMDLPVTVDSSELAELVAAVERAKSELEALSRWAGSQNAGDAFAGQVRAWAESHLEHRVHARFDFGDAA